MDHFTKSGLGCGLILLASAPFGFPQFTTKLRPQTIEQFDQYARNVEQQLEQRWQGRRAFIAVEENQAELKKVLTGDLLVQPGSPDNPIPIFHGLIHDWVGMAFIPNTTMPKLLNILQGFDRHSQIYPNLTRSRLIRRDGNNLTGFWRLKYEQPLVTVVLDVEQEAHYREIGPGKWVVKAYAKKISEVENPGSRREKILPVGEGQGFLWRLYAYWSLKETHDGVLAECRTLSLSRDIPAALAWVIAPFVQNLPRESLAGTLRDTRAAAAK